MNKYNWESKKKFEARNDTIIHAYESLFSFNKIPQDKSYWAMCGQNVNEDGSLREKGEYNHILSSTLIDKPSQFFGVEINKKWHNLNSTIKGPNWLCGDFYSKIIEYSNKNEFNPAIVNVDNVKMVDRSINYLTKILCHITDLNIENVMVVGNIILKCYSHVHHHSDIIRSLCSNKNYRSIADKWIIHPEIYEYNGANEKRTNCTLGTIILYR